MPYCFPRIVTDNINLQQSSRFESKNCQGNRFDWSNQFAVRDRVVNNVLSDECSQQSLMSLDLSQQVIPCGDVLASLRSNFIPLVASFSAIFACLQSFQENCNSPHPPRKFWKDGSKVRRGMLIIFITMGTIWVA